MGQLAETNQITEGIGVGNDHAQNKIAVPGDGVLHSAGQCAGQSFSAQKIPAQLPHADQEKVVTHHNAQYRHVSQGRILPEVICQQRPRSIQ